MKLIVSAIVAMLAPMAAVAWEFTAQFSGEAARTYSGQSRELESDSGNGPWMSVELFDYQATTNCSTSPQMELDVYLGIDRDWEMNGFATLIQQGAGAWRPSAPMAFYAEPRGFDLGEAPARLTEVDVVDLACIDASTARLTLRMTVEIEGPGAKTLTLLIQDDAPVLNYDKDFGT